MIGYQNCGLRLDTVIQCVVTVQLTYSVIRFWLSAEFRPFWPKFGFAEIAKSISVSVSVSAETNVSIGNLPKLSELLLYKPLGSLYTYSVTQSKLRPQFLYKLDLIYEFLMRSR